MPYEIIDYSEAYCNKNEYTDLFPVKYAYEADSSTGLRQYVKKQCICHSVKEGICRFAQSCPRFVNAPAVILR